MVDFVRMENKNIGKRALVISTIAIIIILLIFAFAFVSYAILYWWYKTRYEKHLFKNKANLYNILNFINSALSHGKEKKEIKENLKRAGWTGEQIDYAFKKIRGKGKKYLKS